MTAPTLPAPIALDAATILARAIDAARDRASDLFDGLATLSAMGEAETVEIKGDALRWLADKFRADANEIMSDIDHARQANGGRVYQDAAARYGTPDDDPRFRDAIWRATGGEAGAPMDGER